MFNSLVSLVLTLFLAGIASIVISLPFGYKPLAEIFIAILVLWALIRLFLWPRGGDEKNVWNTNGVEDARSAYLASRRERG